MSPTTKELDKVELEGYKQMEFPKIPETASDEYLAGLREKIFKQLERAKSEKIKQQLRTFLREVQKQRQGKLKLQQKSDIEQSKKGRRSIEKEPVPSPAETKTQQAKIAQWLAQEVPKIDIQAFKLEKKQSAEQRQQLVSEGKNLSKSKQGAVKKRLKETLEKVKTQQVEDAQSRTNVIQAQKHGEVPGKAPPILSEPLTPTEQEHLMIRMRLWDMLAVVKKEGRQIAAEEDQMRLSIRQRLQQQIEEEVQQEADFKQQRAQDLDQEEAMTPEEDLEGAEAGHVTQKRISYEIRADDLPEGIGSVPFEEACERVSNGDTMALFYTSALTQRERQMLKAVDGYLKQLKGLKRQQAFDLQHLTARSVRELDQVFKTYQPQGYLNVELHNVYNRLLTLRSRFSVLLH